MGAQTRGKLCRPTTSSELFAIPPQPSKKKDAIIDENRRKLWIKSAIRVASVGLGAVSLAAWTRPAWASSRSRTDGYAIQKTQEEWKRLLSPMQYRILREGGTEKPYFSILEGEDRPGVFKCAGCGSDLFSSTEKFHSGTGWPSFAKGLEDVEIEDVDSLTAALIAAGMSGAELRCRTCGGHLGDVFNDGFLFVGTPAAKTGKRYCIDGAALVFHPQDNSEPVRGDTPAKKQ